MVAIGVCEVLLCSNNYIWPEGQQKIVRLKIKGLSQRLVGCLCQPVKKLWARDNLKRRESRTLPPKPPNYGQNSTSNYVGLIKCRIYCKLDGYVLQKNVWTKGPARQLWASSNQAILYHPTFVLLPKLASNLMTTFSLSDCHFQIERGREATARVAVWRQFGIPMSYTMEASTCGCDQGPYKNCHLSPRLLLESGDGFCIALSHLLSPAQTLLSQLSMDSESDNSYGD
ncbi:unnamed protein product, partial [Meganyctiphanes norvegica]